MGIGSRGDVLVGQEAMREMTSSTIIGENSMKTDVADGGSGDHGGALASRQGRIVSIFSMKYFPKRSTSVLENRVVGGGEMT